MIYVVTGLPRSGTSMMMQALIAGGMSAAWTPARDGMNTTFGDQWYQPNAGGFYEIPLVEYGTRGWPLTYEGQLIKVMLWGLERMVPHAYRIVRMHRHSEEIRQSFEAAFGEPAPRWPVDRWLSRLDARADCQVTVLQYRAVVERPQESFDRLAAAGWPIDVTSARTVVDPTQYRFRLERLTYGL